MTDFQCIPIATETADRFRETGTDDRGNQVRRFIATPDGSYPCRHCLRLAEPGEAVLLGSYDLPKPQGIYWTPSPIFVHEAACPRADAVYDVAPIVRANPLVSVRAYDLRDQCLYDLGHVCAGLDVDAPLRRALGDARTAFVNIHTARPGCLLSLVTRVADRP
ncbi:hypothetical protein VQ02_32675 [Methylobacterium variabile]|jgi:hypothetical protein|uniref:DUF1203 domain-containing protein n=1 Tax=Methylobacterium variabile TaxID=298794 RepID=A0A0J6S2A2_9HYPH|nr:DUF1203 domain-containing protein [Methylobacterium variabile]KMO27702.1 hypothetical protein VQ02_32675 [Methylobacterium variabile]